MASEKPVSYTNQSLGISDFSKENTIPGDIYSVAFCRSVDLRTDPRTIELLPRTVKDSGSIIEALPKWAATNNSITYIYDAGGNIYSRTATPSYSKLRTVAASHGNGLSYFGEDDFLYYTLDKTIGRYGPLSGTPTFNDDFLSGGGTPTNTHSLTLVATSSQYGYRADTAQLSLADNLCLEIYFKPTTLPAVGSSMTLISKWNESGATRSYLMDILAGNGYFGDGSDGALSIAADTTEAPIDSACSGTSGAYSLTATNTSFAAGQRLLIHQTQGTGAGTYQKNKIISYTAGTITLETALNFSYATGAQVRVMPQYTTVTIAATKTYTVKAWNGTVGGLMAFYANSTVTINGTISCAGVKGVFLDNALGTATGASGGGFRGGNGYNNGGVQYAQTGEGNLGKTTGYLAYGSGGGGGQYTGDKNYFGSDGGGGSHATAGVNGIACESPQGTTWASYGMGATTLGGTTDLTTMWFGGGGGGAVNDGRDPGSAPGEGVASGGSGGGIFYGALYAIVFGASGSIPGVGGEGGDCGSDFGAGGGGAGGSIRIETYDTVALGTNKIVATGGLGGSVYTLRPSGGTLTRSGGANGGDGRVYLGYYTSYTGTTNPTLTATQDNTLLGGSGYNLRLKLSSDGTAVHTFTRPFEIATGEWARASVNFNATTHVAEFFKNGLSIGSQTGTAATIHDNAAEFFIGCNKNSGGTATNFFNGKVDDLRIWSFYRNTDDIFSYCNYELVGNEAYLQAYYKFNNAATDGANANHLTLSGSPSYTTDVPFTSAGDRLDIDLYDTAAYTGGTYALSTTVDESTATERLSFTPTKDPQKSIRFNIAAKGTGDWTITIHDQQNLLVGSKTIANADLATSGTQEFIYTATWRPTLGRQYHAHVNSTVADATLVCDTGHPNDLRYADYTTYYSFLVEDTDYHPMLQTSTGIEVIGNERYVATWDGIEYDNHRLILSPGYRVRCFATWRDYVAIGCWRGTNIYDFDDGRIYFWDGSSDTFNGYIDVPEGGVNAMFGSKGQLHVWAGYQGDHLIYLGGETAEKIKRVPKIATDKYVEIAPGAVTMWKTLLRYGACLNSSSADIERGVYTWGKLNYSLTDILTYDYPISTGSRGTTVKIGLLHVVGSKLLIGWQDNVSYGIDVVDSTAAPFASGTVEYLIRDDNSIYAEKIVHKLKAVFEPLATGESVDIKYKNDRESAWHALGAETTADKIETIMQITSSRPREFQCAVDLATSVSTSPKVLGVSVLRDLGVSEDSF